MQSTTLNKPDVSIMAPTSPGQLLDRITILQIKAKKISGGSRRLAIVSELNALVAVLEHNVPQVPEISRVKDELSRVNARLWDIEDQLRIFEANSDFGQEFIEAARSVYKFNDERCELKRQVDELLGSQITDQKIYLASHYKTPE